MSVLALAGKDLRDVLRERTIVAALAVQLMIAALSTVLAVGVTVLVSPSDLSVESNAPVAYLGDGELDTFLVAEGLRVRQPEADVAERLLEAGRLAAVVVERQNGTRIDIDVHVQEGSLTAVIVIPTIREALQDYQHALRHDAQGRLQTPILDVPEAAAGSVPGGFGVTVLVPLLLLTPAFLSGAIAGDAWTRERQTRTMTLLRASPLTPAQLMGGKLLLPLALAPAQAALWMGVLALGGTVVQNLPLLLVLCSVLAALLAGLGIAVAALAPSTVASQSGYALLVLLAMGASLVLPRDLFNVFALVATGSVLPEVVQVTAVLVLAAISSLALGLWSAARSLRAD